jgi:PAS domain S-box-containing protein
MPESHEDATGWESLFWSVFERSTNAIALLDAHRIYVEVNAAIVELLGAPRDEIVGTRADRFVAPEELPRLDGNWSQLWDSGSWVCERTVVRADGTRVRGQYAAQRGEVGGQEIAVVVWLRVEPEESPPLVALGELTAREREVLSLVALGQTGPQIAEQLVISNETVRSHVRNAMAKTGATTRAQLVAMALVDRHIHTDPRDGPPIAG